MVFNGGYGRCEAPVSSCVYREMQKKACRCGQAIFCISVYAYLRSLSGLAAERTLALRATFAAGASDELSETTTVTAPV